MSEVIVVAVVKPKEGQEKAVEEAFASLIEPTHAEDGCLTYALHRDTRTPGQLVFVERWESMEKLGGHIKSAHYGKVTEATADLLREPTQILLLDPVVGGDPAKGALFPA